MTTTTLAIRRTALVTSVGLDAPSSCAAIRAKLTNPSETRFVDDNSAWLIGHMVPLDQPWSGLAKLARLAAMAIDECLAAVPREDWHRIPVLLCVAEHDRPGRQRGLDDQLFADIEQLLEAQFSDRSAIVAHGKVSTPIALVAARKLLHDPSHPHVVVAGVDSLLGWPTLQPYLKADRLLTPTNSNGFMPGEAAGAVLLSLPGSGPELRCTGVGFGVEEAHLDSGLPLRGDGLAAAIRSALDEAGRQMHELRFRMTDISGEQYHFKEAALALGRTLRQLTPDFDLWHPAESTGEIGAAIGLAMLAVADAACRKGYAPGRDLIAHWSSDNGQRAAAVLQFVEAA